MSVPQCENEKKIIQESVIFPIQSAHWSHISPTVFQVFGMTRPGIEPNSLTATSFGGACSTNQ